MSELSPRRRWLRPTIVTTLVAAVFAIVAYAYASPYLALRALRQAVDARDAQAISRYVDYPALRISLKQQLTDELMRRVDLQRHDNPLAMLGAMIGSALISPLVDAYATPEGVAALISGLPPSGDPVQRPPSLDAPTDDGTTASPSAATPAPAPASPPAADATPAPASGAATAATASRAEAAYHGLDEFIVTYPRDDQARYAAIFRRSGLVGWKLVSIDLHRP
ncbi:MAG: hypothetical protein GAK40_00452 [Burkholderia plantarii]|nr:MAG: hypothetical protein GAK40_00452 [Burkholderia plantarii]